MPPAPALGTLRERIESYQLAAIREALERQNGSWAAAARDLGMHRSNLYHLATRLGFATAANAERAPSAAAPKGDGQQSRPSDRRRRR